MPTYTYACTECGHSFDIRQSFTDDPLTDCPECPHGRLRKVIHPVGIAFKGSGFYKTDSRAGAGKSGAKAGDSKGAPSEGSTGSGGSGGSGGPGGSGGSEGSGSSSESSSGSAASSSPTSTSGSSGSSSSAASSGTTSTAT
ncbi:FmdB family zinc ribbon protein [Intrasporangium sp. DVR]|uniref:FmdB family zinc ribbon protein n=1 Tax=Intrasporangium sp. DVR TaxID=3127867 RepID=UPI00313A5B06